MANKVVFSVFIDIPEDRLDNPGWWENGEQVVTDKSKQTKLALLNNAEFVTQRQKQYANDIGADYILFQYDSKYKNFFDDIKNRFTEISEYDIVNFYKHRVMRDMADEYDYVCYIDFDVVPNTTDCIFEAHNVDKMLAVAESNRLAIRGKVMKSEDYNLCIRNPATKYWNTHALLFEEGYDPENDVFNTGIIGINKEHIEKLDYFGNFDKTIELMTNVKNDSNLYPEPVRDIFGYDNETIWSYKTKVNKVKTQWLDTEWHYFYDPKNYFIPKSSKFIHVINKRFDKVWQFCERNEKSNF